MRAAPVAKKKIYEKHQFKNREDGTKTQVSYGKYTENWKWTELPQNRVHWMALVLAVLNTSLLCNVVSQLNSHSASESISQLASYPKFLRIPPGDRPRTTTLTALG